MRASKPRSRRPRLGRLARFVATGVLGVAAWLANTAPAGAHTVGGVEATNFRTRILSVRPVTAGLQVRVVDNGERLELTNRTGRELVVLGYDGEPYLRIGPRGVFENTRSPATFSNRFSRNPPPPPPRADPNAPPEWRRIGDGPTARWHDHRVHWMGAQPPPLVQRAPHDRHRIQAFVIELRLGDRTVRVRGDLWWIPGPSPWPWIALVAGLVAVVAITARTRLAAGVVGAVLALTLVAVAIHATGAWAVATNPVGDRALDAIPTLVVLSLGGAALGRLTRRGLHAEAPLLVFAGLAAGIAVGFADLDALTHSQLPSELPSSLDRATIAGALGGGIAVAIGAARHVRTPVPPPPARDVSAGDPTAAFLARREVAVGGGRPGTPVAENHSHVG